ncbi:alginate lyase-domain-containing protein [Phellopilus nigrolimitatus]|nr:alginate lyase-domain-containing protein [Phellopilus nigrolimitatus]
MIRRVRRFAHAPAPRKRAVLVAPGDALQLNLSQRDIPDVTSITLPTGVPDTQPSSTSDNVAGGSAAAAENARNTQKAQPNPKTTSAPKGQATHQAPPSKTTAGGSDSDCTPSPSKSMPPSATWTTCNYVTKDGQLNPDVRLLNGVIAIVDVTQSVLWNVVASVLAGTSDTAQTAVQFMQDFFLDDKTGMHPRVAYGQVIRGPGQQVGEFLGVIDLRGMVKIANAIQIMRAAGTSAWTSTLDAQMVAWTQQYVKWLQSSSIGQTALSAPNNHGSFATNQLAAMNILDQNHDDAAAALNAYFKKQFQDQIAASGEQPFEAVRTRPYHYRCFNLEAMITNAKLGDQLGLNFWTAKSKHGATIKDALDFTLRQNPGKEDVSDIFPHVAAIAAAYGDADGKYAAFLKRADDSYLTASYYYYDQAAALTQAPSTGPKAKGKSVTDSLAPTPTNSGLPFATPTIPWACPAAFATTTQVQLDDSVYVTCDELKHLYGYTDKAKNV